jgi:surface protein
MSRCVFILFLFFVFNTTRSPVRIRTITLLLCFQVVLVGSARSLSLYLCLNVIIMDDPSPTAKRQKTTTAEAEDNKEESASILDGARREATAKDDDRTILDLLRSLPANVVANYIYPFAVKVIQNREELIQAVDEYFDEFYTSGNPPVYWSDEEDDDDEDDEDIFSSDDEEEAEEQQDALSSTLSDNDRISPSGPSHQSNSMAPRGNSDDYSIGEDEKGEDDDEEDENLSDDEDEVLSDQNRIRYAIGDWDISSVEDFTSVFDYRRNFKALDFNEDLSRWNVTNGIRFVRMFYGCRSFNSDVSNWNTDRATDLRNMFCGCPSLLLQSDLSRWNTTELERMFGSPIIRPMYPHDRFA